MLDADAGTLRARAERLAAALDGLPLELVETVARVGGGALPLLELPGPALALGDPATDPGPLAQALRTGRPALLGRIADGRLLIDPRTLADDELDPAASAIAAAMR
jgi:L-seryl-tRNA(Ser) seleniumtransferase